MARPADPQIREKLLAASAAEFAAKGFVGAKIEEITTRAGYSKAAFYLHFDSKESAFRELVADFFAKIGEALHDDDSFLQMDLGIEAGETVLERWVDKQIRICEYLWEHRTVARLVFDPPQDVELRQLTGQMSEGGRERLERFLTWGIRQGYFAESLDPALASLLFTGAQQELIRKLITRTSRPDIAGEVRRSHRTLLEGLLSPAMRPQGVAPAPSAADAMTVGQAQGSRRFMLGGKALNGGDIVELCCSGGWLTGRFEWKGTTDVPATFHFSVELGAGKVAEQSLVIPEGTLLRRV